MSDDKVIQKAGDANTYYPLNRDLFASARLNLQHHVWTQSHGYLLHPSIPVAEHALIADIGCGTGIAATEIAKSLPAGGQVEGLDLSLEQCPPKAWWPDNVRFHQLDILGPIPERLVGRYDIVFIRHFICVVQSGDPMPLLSALLRLLKPGGYLQWQEWDLLTNEVVRVDSSLPTPRMEAFVQVGFSSIGKQIAWVPTFDSRLSEVPDAELLAYERHRTAKEAMLMRQEVGFLTCREWCEGIRARDPNSEQADYLERMGNEAFGECVEQQRGTVIDCDMVTWVVRKP